MVPFCYLCFVVIFALRYFLFLAALYHLLVRVDLLVLLCVVVSPILCPGSGVVLGLWIADLCLLPCFGRSNP